MEAHWYIIHALSGFENKIAQAIRDQAEKFDLAEYFHEIVVPTEQVIEIKKGKKVNIDKKFFPGYILVKMVMNEDSWHLVRNIPKVSGFLGSHGKPQIVSQKEVESILKQIAEGDITSQVVKGYEIGESVKITDGPFESFVGVVEEVDMDKARLKVSVSIFGRSTPVDLDFSQVTKI